MRPVCLLAATLTTVGAACTTAGTDSAPSRSAEPSSSDAANAPDDAGDATTFATDAGASIWSDSIDEVELTYEHVATDELIPNIFQSPCAVDGGWAGRVQLTYTFAPASRAFAWTESCAADFDGAGPESAHGQRTLSTTEAAGLITALRAVTVGPSAYCSSDIDLARVTVHVGSAEWAYVEGCASRQAAPSYSTATGVANALDAAHALAH